MRIQIRRTRCLRFLGRNGASKHLAGCISSAPCGSNRRRDLFTRRLNMQLDKALQFAVVQSWEDLTRGTAPSSIRVEYQGEPGTSLDYLRVWSDRGGGYQRWVCDYWTWTSPAHPSGVHFTNGYHSDGLGQALDFIMKNQDQFARPSDACRDGLVLIHPPTGDQRAEATTWRAEGHGIATNFGSAADEGAPLSGTSLTDLHPGSASL